MKGLSRRGFFEALGAVAAGFVVPDPVIAVAGGGKFVVLEVLEHVSHILPDLPVGTAGQVLVARDGDLRWEDPTPDNEALDVGISVLLLNQTDPARNGIWRVTETGLERSL